MTRPCLHANGRLALRGRGASSGFTLLEVLVAIAILGLGLTVILSSQAGLFSSASRGEHLTVATNLLRCKMTEIELELDQKGFSLTDENNEGDCCGDDEGAGFNCAWKIERVELPPMPEASSDADAGAGTDPMAAAGPPADALSKLQGVQSAGDQATPGAALEQLGAATSGSGLEGLVMGFVYPNLKPMLEASIRRVTVKVTWTEGTRPRELEVTQFLTRPQEGQLATADQANVGGSTAGGLIPGMPNIPGLPGLTGTGGSGSSGRGKGASGR